VSKKGIDAITKMLVLKARELEFLLPGDAANPLAQFGHVQAAGDNTSRINHAQTQR
jgi:hypothetical protein